MLKYLCLSTDYLVFSTSTVKKTFLTTERDEFAYTDALARKKGNFRVVDNCDKKQINVQCECALNIVKGNMSMNVNQLMSFEQKLNDFVNRKHPPADGDKFCHPSNALNYLSGSVVPAFAIHQQNESSRIFNNTQIKLHQESTKRSEFLDDLTITAKSQQLTLLQRVPEKKSAKTLQEVKAPDTRENIQKRVLRSITMLNPHHTEKFKSFLNDMQRSSDVLMNDEGFLEMNKIPTAIGASSLLFTLQQPIKKHYQPKYKRTLEKTSFHQF